MANTRSAGPKTVREARAVARAHPLVASILDADDLPTEPAEVPEWGVTLLVRGLDGLGRDAYERQLFHMRQQAESGEVTIESRGSRYADLLSRCLCDPETGERLPLGPEDLAHKSGAVLKRLADIALRLSGMGTRAAESAEGNSGAAQSGSSTSG